MAKRGLYQKDLIDVFKVKTRGAVGHYLSGRREPTIEQLIALAELLGVSVSELVGEIPLTGNSQDTQEILTLLRGIPPERFAAMIPLLRSLSEQPVPAASGAEEAS